MASGYDLSSRVPFRLMKGRLGVYDKRPFEPAENSISGVEDQSIRLRQMGGNRQQERMIKDKRRSLDRALWNSYQAAEIIKIDATDRKPVRALINPNKLKQDYDDKILSVGYEYNVTPGTVFEWLGTHTYWIVYLQDLTELAYFRGDVRRCSYQIAWEDENGNKHKTYAAVRGPVEAKINSLQKNGISLDTPNHSLSILMPKDDDTLKYFKRYSKFYLQDYETCWRVEATDSISTPGILEVIAIEYYANETEDDVDEGIVGGLIEPIQEPNGDVEVGIVGNTFIKVKREYEFHFEGTLAADWYVDVKYPVILKVNTKDPRELKLIWDSPYSGQFELKYGDYSKTIVVESLF